MKGSNYSMVILKQGYNWFNLKISDCVYNMKRLKEILVVISNDPLLHLKRGMPDSQRNP